MQLAKFVKVSFSYKCHGCGKTIQLELPPVELHFVMRDKKALVAYTGVCAECGYYNELEIFYGDLG